MSTPAISPEAHKKGFIWKRLVIKAAGFGAGFALVFAILAGVGIWYWNRPKPPKPWDTTSIKGSYYRIERIRENNTWHLEFKYILENTSNHDYNLQKFANYHIAGKLSDTGSLTGFADDNGIILKIPIFIPAQHKTRVDIVLPSYDVDVAELATNPSKEERQKYYDAIENAVSDKMSNLNGFVLFDENLRYEISLPSGWKKAKK